MEKPIYIILTQQPQNLSLCTENKRITCTLSYQSCYCEINLLWKPVHPFEKFALEVPLHTSFGGEVLRSEYITSLVSQTPSMGLRSGEFAGQKMGETPLSVNSR